MNNAVKYIKKFKPFVILLTLNLCCQMFWRDQGGMFVLTPAPLQLEEDLEQLKVLENGYKMKVL